MNAVLNPYEKNAPQLRLMRLFDLDQIMAIENVIYPHPWTRGNFEDALKNAYHAWVGEIHGKIIGYFVLAVCVDDLHLLTIGVAKNEQGKGFGGVLLEQAFKLAKLLKIRQFILEVRASNLAAINLYHNFGFSQIGIRRGYYPAENGAREDALVLCRKFPQRQKKGILA